MQPNGNVQEPSTVGKTQKTLALHDQICELIQAYADKKGSSFQRIVEAAVLQFFFGSTQGPDEAWHAICVPLQKGKIDLPAVPSRVFEDYAKELERKVALRKEKGFDDDEWTRRMERWIEASYSDAGVWRSSISIYGGGMKGLIEFATTDTTERDLRRFVAPPEDDSEAQQ
ncbi:MAG: hypothetical protein IIA33_07125 [Planctomycetes bacterium]|nr:hypothetical protein [Planctomycetota bacterium]